MLIGIGATKLVGKDTLFGILQVLLKDTVECNRVALADILKVEVSEFTQKHYGISAFTKDPKEKEIIRSCFLSHGLIKRTISNGTYWTSLAQPQVDLGESERKLNICTDIRYAIYQNDEITWLKEKNKGIYIHLNRYNNGIKMVSDIPDEIQNSKKLETLADYTVNWETSSDINYLQDTVKIQLAPLLKRIQEEYK